MVKLKCSECGELFEDDYTTLISFNPYVKLVPRCPKHRKNKKRATGLADYLK